MILLFYWKKDFFQNLITVIYKCLNNYLIFVRNIVSSIISSILLKNYHGDSGVFALKIIFAHKLC